MLAPFRKLLVRQVRAVFHDAAKGEGPVPASEHGLFPPGSPIRRVHGDVSTMMVGGIAALLMQMLHPSALAGIWEHSRFRDDLRGRLRRTARFIAVTTYGARDEALDAIARVNAMHRHVEGARDDGTPYSARDPALLAWVHVTEATCFLDAWQRYGDRPLDAAGRDSYHADFARIARGLGADPVPRSAAEADAVIARMRPLLAADARTEAVARLILSPPGMPPHLWPAFKIAASAAVDLLPGWARTMHGLAMPALARPAIRGSAAGLARTLRWAFR